MITLEQALARADTMTGCTETQEVVKVLAAEVRRLQLVTPKWSAGMQNNVDFVEHILNYHNGKQP